MSMTVCIPACNGAPFIGATLQSILEQTLQDLECIVVDDASDDGTLDVVRSLGDPRIRIYQNEMRRGTAANRNRCLELTRTEYVCLIDQDDLMLPDNLERKRALLAADPTISFVHSAASNIVEAGAAAAASWEPGEDYIAEGNTYFRKLLFGGNHICACSVVARTHLLRDRGGFDTAINYACDYEMWMKLAVNNRVAFVGTPLVRYRWHEQNQSHQFSLLSRFDEIEIAGRRALEYFRAATGRADEACLLEEAFAVIARANRCVGELYTGNTWLATERGKWERMAQDQEALIQELRAQVDSLYEQRKALEGQAGSLRSAIVAYEASRWFRLGAFCKKLVRRPA